jgi:hypothetical protein
MKSIVSIVLVSFIALSANAQQKTPAQAAQKAPALATQRPAAQAQAPKGDTVKLRAAFKELYPLIRPAQSMKERTELALRRMDRMFKMQGVDSAKAHDSVMAAINPNQEEEILYNVYADNFSPDEIKAFAAFFKTPAGKHYLEVENRLTGARQQSEQYINRTINLVTAPMRKPREPRDPNAPGMPARQRPGMRPAPGQGPGQAPAPAPTTPPEQH